MKKLMAIILVSILCLSLISCDTLLNNLVEEETSAENSNTTSDITTVKEDDTEKEEETTKEETSKKYTFKVQSDSMYPTFKAGSIIRYEKVADAAELKVGDIIIYWTIINGERVKVAHRIVNIYDGGSFLLFETKGDANEMANPLTVHESEIIGKFVGIVK